MWRWGKRESACPYTFPVGKEVKKKKKTRNIDDFHDFSSAVTTGVNINSY